MAAVVEDGTGLEGAQVYQSEAETVTLLSGYDLNAYSGASTGAQTFYLIVATAAADALLKTPCVGDPYNPNQGLYLPRTAPYNGVPETVKLTTALLAEANVLEAQSTSQLEALPDKVTEVELADGVRMRKAQGLVENAAVSRLRAQANDLLEALRPKPRHILIKAH